MIIIFESAKERQDFVYALIRNDRAELRRVCNNAGKKAKGGDPDGGCEELYYDFFGTAG